MTDLAYLQARLPPLSPDLDTRPLGVSEFLAVLKNSEERYWCRAILAWLSLANSEAARMQLPRPYPDADDWEDDHEHATSAWANYYRVLGHLTAPELVRTWAREDQAMIAHRARLRGAEFALSRGAVPRADLAALVEGRPESVEAARMQDHRVLAYEFSRLDQYLLGEPPDSPIRLYAYAIRLLLLARAGIRIEVSHAA